MTAEATTAESTTAEFTTAEITKALAELLPRLRAYARVLTKNSPDADDLVQTAVERALSRIELYQPGTNFKAWMFTILRNCYFTEMRKRARRPDTVDPADHEGALSVRAEQQVGLEVRDFSRAFARLSEMDRTVLILVGAEGMSYQEAADVLGTPIGTVRSRLSRARTRLKELLEGTPASGSAGPEAGAVDPGALVA
ncbi:sigma-70 family RNA polymerase sigma factor [Tistlia consotensis]|nr:sigma-70 family RNA polymerase sigma factor [Tistlia consotensis]